ncbi:NmrA/HSCARG family protein [Lentzea aerocolonigenes]|uniref:NmrA/HSCARG family protein n=1 Tax=Lentzea aerocolonigenes TaxID=68170 RepID=UPI0006967112|nr:NmrA/HSCARG family protein [Lentzea aerocolonigenes]
MDGLVAVLGATGRQGGAVARHLLADGRRVRALTRDPSSAKARRLAEAGAEVMRVDMSDVTTLRPAFAGAHGVFSVQNPMICGLDEEVVQGRNVGDAAAEAGVRHVVYGSAGIDRAGTGVGSWESKMVIKAHLQGLGLPLTVLRPMALMELMTDKDFYPPVSMWHLMPKLIGGDRPLLWLCSDDFGAVAARVFAEPDGFVGEDLPLVSDVLSINGCRDHYREAFGRPPRRFPMPIWLFERFVGDDLITMWRWLRDNPVEADPAATRAIVPSARTVREWLSSRAR